MTLKQRHQMWVLKRRMKQAITTLQALEQGFIRSGCSRQFRKEFWRKMSFAAGRFMDVKREIMGTERMNWLSIESIKRWFVCRRIESAVSICRRLDDALVNAGWERRKRRDFWKQVAIAPSSLCDVLRSVEQRSGGGHCPTAGGPVDNSAGTPPLHGSFDGGLG